MNSDRPVEKASAETYVNSLLSRLWDAPKGKVRDLGSPLASAAPHRGGLHHSKPDGSKAGVSKHPHVSFNVIEGEEGFEDQVLGHHANHNGDQPHHFYRKPTPRASIEIYDNSAKHYVSGLINRWK